MQQLRKFPCPFLTRLSTPYKRHHGQMLVKTYAEICPVASRMVTTTGATTGSVTGNTTVVEGRALGKINTFFYAHQLSEWFIHFLIVITGNVVSSCPFKESDGNNTIQTATPVVDHDLINIASKPETNINSTTEGRQ